MAQLKDSVITGSLRVTDTTYTTDEVISSLTASQAVLTDTNKKLVSRNITNNTSKTAVTASTNLITANTLYYHSGNSNITTVGTVTTGVWDATVINPNKGGTGVNSYAKGDILYAGAAIANSATTALSKLTIGTSGQVLETTSNGIPGWITATDSNTASTIVKRDSNGGFSAETITLDGDFTTNGDIYLTRDIADLTDAANGTGDNNNNAISYAIYNIDVNDFSWLCLEGLANPDGTVSAFLGIRNCATDGTPQSWKGLTITQQKGSDATSFSIGGQFIAELIPSSWINGQRYNNAAYNIADYDNAGSYNPWMRATNTWSSGEENEKVGRWFSFGTRGSSFYWLGSTTTRTENGVDQSMDFDISSGDLTVSHSITSSTGSIMAPEGDIWAGTDDDTTAQREVGVQSGSGRMFMYAQAATSGDRGIYVPAHGSGGARSVFSIDTNNRIYFADSYNGTATALAYSQSGLAASAITWLTCWNGYELRAISKAEMANAVDSAHKWVRIGGDTMTGQLYINLDQDVGLNQSGSLVIGTKTGSNIGIDGNEIMARSNSAASTLYINSEGGLVYIGSGQLQVNSTITSSNGYLKSTCNSNTVTIGSQNSGFCHIYNSADIPFIFNKQIQTMSSFKIYNANTYLSNNYLVFAQGGGWYMGDSTWIRSYGSKSVYINTGDLRCDGSTWGGKCRLTNDWLGFYSGNGGGTRYGFLEVTSTKYYFRKENGADTYPFDFNGNITFSGILYSSSYVELRTSNSYQFRVQTDGNVVLYNSGGGVMWKTNTSSSRLVKENISPLDQREIDNLKKLNVIRFNYRPEMKEADTSRRYGLIAEEVLPLFPDVVDVPENYDASKFDITKGYDQPVLGIKYERFIPILIKAVQVQDKEIQQLKSEIQYLKNRR